jgi:hypothetical protein
MERENLAGDAKGKGASGSNREAESTDAPERGGLPRSSSPPALPAHNERNADTFAASSASRSIIDWCVKPA